MQPISATQLVQLLQQNAANSPYIIEPKPYGFDLKLNIVDAKWYNLLAAHSLKRTFTIEATIDESSHSLATNDRTFTIPTGKPLVLLV